MRTLGLIGGMSWESTAHYYRLINEGVRARKGGLHSAPLVMLSVDFAAIAALQHDGDWAGIEARMVDAAQRLEQAGAEAIAIATNTIHKVAPAVEAATGVPLLHIADAAAEAIVRAGYRRIGLLGTAFTMEQPFYRERLERHGLSVIVPNASQRAEVHRIIYDELVRGEVNDASRAFYRATIAALVDQGADAVVLGCTEIMLLVQPTDAAVPLFDTTALHAAQAVEFILSA